MYGKIAEILGKINGTVLMAAALGIVLITFIIGLIVSMGGDLGKFKKAAKQAIKEPAMSNFNATAKMLPTRARKQYKAFKQHGGKADDVITPDACVYAPFKESAAAKFPGAVMAAGLLSILLSFFACLYVKGDGGTLIPALVTAGVMILRLAAGLISSAILKSGLSVYDKYVTALSGAMRGGQADEPTSANDADIPFVRPEEPVNAAYGNTFEEPTHITVELADEEAQPEFVQAEPVNNTIDEERLAQMRAQQAAAQQAAAQAAAQQAAAQAAAQQAVAAQQAAAQQAAAQQAAAQAAAQQAAAQQAAAQQAAQAAAQQAAQDAQGSSSADEVIARIETITREGAPLATMKEVALLLQKERAKPENKTPERQRKLNEALASLLKAMSGATRK